MPIFIADTTDKFKIKPCRVTRSAACTCFIPFSHCFSTVGRMHITLRSRKQACPTLSPIPRSSSVSPHNPKCCFYLFVPFFPLFFYSRTDAHCATTTESGIPHFIGHTTVWFEIQPRCVTNVTQSAVFSSFIQFSRCFPRGNSHFL